MPVALSYPGVYVEEIPSGVRTIVGVPTAIAAFIGRAARGPVNDPVTINSFGDFERIFGGLWTESRLGYAVRDFFLNGGGQAVIVRVFTPEVIADDDPIKVAARATADRARAELDKVNMTEAMATSAKDDVDKVIAKFSTDTPKESGARKIKEDFKDRLKADSPSRALLLDLDKALGGVTPDSWKPGAQAAADAIRTKIDVLMKADADAAADAAQAAADGMPSDDDATKKAKAAAAFVAAQAREAVNEPTLSGFDRKLGVAVDDAAPSKAQISIGDTKAIVLEAKSPGAWANALRAATTNVANGKFNLIVRDMATGVTERHLNLTLEPGSRQISKVLRGSSQLVDFLNGPETGQPFESCASENVGELFGLKDLAKSDIGKFPPGTERGNRSFGVGVRAGDGQPIDDDAIRGDEDKREGLYALEKLYADGGLFNLLCIPPYTDEEGVDKEVVTAAAEYCVDRRAFLIVDPPPQFNVANFDTAKANAKRGMANPDDEIGTKSKNAAIFFPRLLQSDPLSDNQIAAFAPCGTVAGVFARTDAERGVWKAPAGLGAGLVGVPKLEHRLTDAENGELNPLGLNCLRTFPVTGNVVWGSRTLEGADQLASEWKYIPVRRTALYIEESLYRGTQWVVFEPNDEPLWGQIRLNVGAFMHGLFRQGAFQGSSPQDAYFVRCDKDTNPPNDINQGIVNIHVGFAPLKPAEFVVIKLQQMAGQIAI